MTEKKTHILNTALQLFAKNGYTSTSTNKIAKEAKVSEGLIFRHFGNKEGLLQSIMQIGNEKASAIFSHLTEIISPEERLKSLLDIPFSIPESEHSFWRLLYSLKWQAEEYDEEMSLQLNSLLTETFKELQFEQPRYEADLAMMLFDGMATAILLKNYKRSAVIQQMVYKKFNLST